MTAGADLNPGGCMFEELTGTMAHKGMVNVLVH